MDAAQAVARLIRGVETVYIRKWPFLALFLLVFFVSFSLLMASDLVPNSVEPAKVQADATPTVTLDVSPLVAAAGVANVIGTTTETKNVKSVSTVTSQRGELPVKIVIPSIGVSAIIANPTSTTIAALDATLVKGAARYPTSASLGEDGNIILFGHSSYLPVVHNQAYKTFDGIQDLKSGDRITVYSTGKAYEYAVDSVSEQNATSDYAIPLSVSGRVLTLATCNTFGKKSDRFIVTAHFVDSYPLGT